MEPEESMTAQPCARRPAQRWRVAFAALWLVWGAAAQAQTALATTTYGYDETANKTSQVDALGRKTEWTFDARDRVAARTLPDGTQETYRYDALANALSRTTFAGETFQFQYDANNNLTGQVIPAGTGTNSAIGGGSVLTTYTPTGNVATRQEQGATTLEGLQSFRYDANDRLIEARSPIGHISYSLDPMGNVLERSIPGAGTVRYELDAAGRLARVLAADGKATVYSYDAAGRLIAVERELNPLGGQPQSLVRSIGYDAADQPVTLSEVKRVGASLTFVVGQTITRGPGGVVSKIETHRGHGTSSTDGQLTAKVEAIQSFEYDALARLTRELRSYAGASTDTRYEYDAVGNRSRKIVIKAIGTEITTYTYDIADRLVHESTSLMTGGSRVVSYTWDSNGNLASKAEPGQVTLYRFDPRNRLIDIRVGATQAEAQEASPKVRYAYDAEGNRVRKWTGEERGYLVDANTVFAQVALEATPASSIEYVRGLELIRQTSRTGTTIEDLFPLHGHLGTSLGALNADGDLIEQVDSDAFGNMDQRAGLKQTHLYAGEYWDQDSQLLYLGARWYDPRIGRFASADPFEGRQRDPRSLNRYAYAHSDPVHSVDPTGRFSLIASPVFSAMVNVGIRLGGAGIATGVMVRVAAQLVRMGVRTSTLVKVLADNCATDAALTDRNCRGELPTFFLGDDYREHTQFVSWAQAGASPKTLTRSTRSPVGWYRGTPECDGLTGRASGLDCDEYPYVSTTQGGPRNYPGQVVLEPVPIPDNRGAGAKLGAFYRNGDCPIPPDSGDRSNFLVVPVLGAPSTYWTCGK